MSAVIKWGTAPPRPTLRAGELHVWRLKTGAESDARGLLSTLTPEEVGRAERFHFERDRARFVLARATLRKLLGRYLGADASSLVFRHNEYGKPALGGGWAGARLNFNLSHSNEVVLYAFALGREVGIDVEHVRPELCGEELAARFFSAPENEALRAKSADTRPLTFFCCWTRKEAYIKARGEGLSFPLDRFAVSVDPECECVTLDVFEDPVESRRWTIFSLLPEAGYVGAVAAEGRDWRVSYWEATL